MFLTDIAVPKKPITLILGMKNGWLTAARKAVLAALTRAEKKTKARQKVEAHLGDEKADESSSWVDMAIEAILAHRFSKGGALEYRIKWENSRHKTWEPADNLNGCDDILTEYNRAKGLVLPQPIAASCATPDADAMDIEPPATPGRVDEESMPQIEEPLHMDEAGSSPWANDIAPMDMSGQFYPEMFSPASPVNTDNPLFLAGAYSPGSMQEEVGGFEALDNQWTSAFTDANNSMHIANGNLDGAGE
ncbi:hypothetical protein EV121DRAFT_298177 [Schizophyllum commune]